ncbi:hypothetical protein VNO77_02875 [Canavalia gladiata]|uniref:Uncharacterized protein n=1 Tax=Canavalia gladiata TaxID=3824 RepID=A0AAN9R7M5_CANGL
MYADIDANLILLFASVETGKLCTHRGENYLCPKNPYLLFSSIEFLAIIIQPSSSLFSSSHTNLQPKECQLLMPLPPA